MHTVMPLKKYIKGWAENILQVGDKSAVWILIFKIKIGHVPGTYFFKFFIFYSFVVQKSVFK